MNRFIKFLVVYIFMSYPLNYMAMRYEFGYDSPGYRTYNEVKKSRTIKLALSPWCLPQAVTEGVASSTIAVD